MLGIGDIVMPGLLLCFVLRYDNYKKQANSDTCGTPGPGNISGRMQKVSYFHCTLIGYFVGKGGGSWIPLVWSRPGFCVAMAAMEMAHEKGHILDFIFCNEGEIGDPLGMLRFGHW